MDKFLGATHRYAELRKEMKEMKAKYLEVGKDFFKSEAKALFDNNKDLESFSWTQYTPYFNDGDACYFGVHTDYPNINGIDYWRDNDEPLFNKLTEARYNELVESIGGFLDQFEKNEYQEWFGDHVEVTVSREGDDIVLEVSDHEHD